MARPLPPPTQKSAIDAHIDLLEVTRRLDSALQLVRQDRWLLGGLRDGRLRVIADSQPETGKIPPRYRELSPMARRSLYERTALTFSSMLDTGPPTAEQDWELEWPALLYVPVGVPDRRPIGVLILGSRVPLWWTEDDVEFISDLAMTLTACVQIVTGPLGRLKIEERRVAQFLSEGLSDHEIACAMELGLTQVQDMVQSVMQKLSLRSRHSMGNLLPERVANQSGYLL